MSKKCVMARMGSLMLSIGLVASVPAFAQTRPSAASPVVEQQARQVMEQLQKALPAPATVPQAAGVTPAAPGSSAPSAAPQQPGPVIREVQPASVRREQLSAVDDGVRSTAPLIPNRIRMYAGQARVYRIPGSLRRVAIGNGEVLTALNVGRDELVLMATAQGDTTMHLWMSNGSQRELDVQVVGANVETLSQTIRQLLQDIPGITINPVGSNVIVSGTNLTEGAMTRIGVIQKAYPQVLNFASLDPVGMAPMISMDVQVIEVDKNALDKLGIDWSPTLSGPSGGVIADWRTNRYFRILPKGDSTLEEIKDRLPTALGTPQTYFGLATTIMSSINLLMSNGKAWILASPRLSARSGSNASFLAGGEVPIPMPGAFGQVTVEFKQYGIKLDISPTVNDRREIFTKVLAEVSRIDPSVTVMNVPGFLTRRAETEINVKHGETMVIAGLIGTEASKDAQKLPLLGDIPILGRLFRSDGFRARKTELVVLVTPRVVTPDAPQNIEGIRRGDDIRQELLQESNKRQRNYVN